MAWTFRQWPESRVRQRRDYSPWHCFAPAEKTVKVNLVKYLHGLCCTVGLTRSFSTAFTTSDWCRFHRINHFCSIWGLILELRVDTNAIQCLIEAKLVCVRYVHTQQLKISRHRVTQAVAGRWEMTQGLRQQLKSTILPSVNKRCGIRLAEISSHSRDVCIRR